MTVENDKFRANLIFPKSFFFIWIFLNRGQMSVVEKGKIMVSEEDRDHMKHRAHTRFSLVGGKRVGERTKWVIPQLYSNGGRLILYCILLQLYLYSHNELGPEPLALKIAFRIRAHCWVGSC